MLLTGNCCFFVNVKNKEELYKKQRWYVEDIRILRELGFSVTVCTQFKEIPWGYDLYFSWGATGSILALFKALFSRKPIIIVPEGQEVIFSGDSLNNDLLGYPAKSWYKKIAVRICLKYSTKVLAVSNFMFDHIKRLFHITPVIVYNCINTNIFKPLYLPKEFVMTIIRLDKSSVILKRGEIFIRSIPIVLQKFPKQKFIIIGEKSNFYNNLIKLITNLEIKDNIKFTGLVENFKIPKFLNRAKIYVQISESESFGMSIAEAMSCGVPTIISKKGAIPEVVGDCGIYVNNNDPNSLANAIIKLLGKSKNELQEIGFSSRSRIVENFSYEKRREKIKQIIKEL